MTVEVVVPYIDIRVYRPLLDLNDIIKSMTDRDDPMSGSILDAKLARKNIRPSPIHMKQVYKVHKEELKGMEHEETALFGHVFEFSIGTQPSSELFRKILPNDHIEAHYENMGYKDATKTQGSLFDQLNEFETFSPSDDALDSQTGTALFQDLDDSGREVKLKPKFQGAVWKGSLIQKPNQMGTKINGWGYLRMLQYLNIPRNASSGQQFSTQLSTLGITDEYLLKNGRADSINYRNDFLDYVDSLFDEYTDNLKNATLFSPIRFVDRGIKYLTDGAKKAGSQYVITSEEAPAAAGTQLYDNWSAYMVDKINDFDASDFDDITTKKTSMGDIMTEIEEAEQDSWSVIRFLDNIINLTDANKGATNFDTVEKFRVIGEVIVMDQVYLTNLLVAGVTVDHGLNTWYTPVIQYNQQYLRQIKQVNGGIHSIDVDGQAVVKGGLSKLIYVRFKIGQVENDEPVEEKKMKKVTAFNFDTFNIMANFDDVVGSSFYNLNSFSQNVPTPGAGKVVSDLTDLEKLALVFSTVSLPMNDDVFVTNIHLLDFHSATDSNNSLSSPEGRAEARKILMDKLSQNIQWMSSTLRADDGIIDYLKNIPASYMRQDVYQGSQFKVATVDSLSLPRIIQIITSTMKGYPATNNPRTSESLGGDVSTGKANSSNVNNYGIFLANRVVIEPQVVYVEHNGVTRRQNPRTVNFPYTESLRNKIPNNEKRQYYMFLILNVGFKEQVSDESQIDYEVDIGKVNELEMIKGTATNHMFNFRLNSNFQESQDLWNFEADADQNESYQSVFDPKIFMYIKDEGDFGYSPSEFQTLDISDMTQDFKYDAVRNRSSLNGFFPPVADAIAVAQTSGEFPIRHPILTGYGIKNLTVGKDNVFAFFYNKIDDESRAVQKVVQDASTQMASAIYPLHYNAAWIEANVPDLFEVLAKKKLLAVTKFCDITDLVNEINYLKELNDDEKLQYRHIANAAEPLFDNILVKAPFTLKKNSDRNFKIINVPFNGTMSDWINDTYDLLNDITLQDMTWNFPIEGWRVNNIVTLKDAVDETQRTFEQVHFEKIDVLSNVDKFSTRVSHNLAAVYLLDMMIKGIRYILWSIAKSRFTAHSYIPIEHVEDRHAQKPAEGRAEEKYGINYQPIVAGSSLRFKMQEDNMLLNPSSGTSLDKSNNDMLDRTNPTDKNKNDIFDPHPFIYVKSRKDFYDSAQRESSALQNQLFAQENLLGMSQSQQNKIKRESAEAAGKKAAEKVTLVWYVSKRITYIGQDSGVMVRLLLTEGSFDWTIFWREDTIATRISENYLLTGMGNFFLRGGQR